MSRHMIRGRQLSRDTEHRKALRRNLVQSLFEHGKIRTTLPKAKEVKAMAEKLITLAKQNTLTARRRVISTLNDRRLVDEKQEFTGQTVVQKLFTEVAPEVRRPPRRLHPHHQALRSPHRRWRQPGAAPAGHRGVQARRAPPASRPASVASAPRRSISSPPRPLKKDQPQGRSAGRPARRRQQSSWYRTEEGVGAHRSADPVVLASGLPFSGGMSRSLRQLEPDPAILLFQRRQLLTVSARDLYNPG